MSCPENGCWHLQKCYLPVTEILLGRDSSGGSRFLSRQNTFFYRQLGFEGDGLAVLSALTVGDKTELSDSVRESYSVAGASHVLALSGLHIGLLYALLFFILSPVAKRGNAGRCLRAVFLLILLWAFAFFTGLSPSVVRSACMFSIWAVADIFNRQALSLNTWRRLHGLCYFVIRYGCLMSAFNYPSWLLLLFY